jgi:succinate dehydrogenase / fumarate reductase flavoprotein subunit
MILQTLYQQCIKNEVAFFDEFQVVDLILEGTYIKRGRGRGTGHRRIARLCRQGRPFRHRRIRSHVQDHIECIRQHRRRSGGVRPARDSPEDMEFFQFHPTGIMGLGILISEAVRGEGGILRSRDGERFMERYSPTLLDLAPRDIVARSILTEVRAGQGIRGDRRIDDYVHLDATHLGKETLGSKLPDITGFCKTYLGIDPADTPIPVLPTAHYAMGGIPTDVHGRVILDGAGTIVNGLYAAGECACVSVHGANRLGTNSLLDLVVFGRRAGQHIGGYVRQADMPHGGRHAADASRPLSVASPTAHPVPTAVIYRRRCRPA